MSDITVSKDAWDSVHEQCSRLRQTLANAETKLRIKTLHFETLLRYVHRLRCEECDDHFHADEWDRKFPVFCSDDCEKKYRRVLNEEYYGELNREREME